MAAVLHCVISSAVEYSHVGGDKTDIRSVLLVRNHFSRYICPNLYDKSYPLKNSCILIYFYLSQKNYAVYIKCFIAQY